MSLETFNEELVTFFTNLEKEAVSLVTQLITTVETDVKLIGGAIDSLFAYVQNAAPALTSDLADAISLANAALSVGAPSYLKTAIADAQTAVDAVNAIASTRANEITAGANAVTADGASAVAAYKAVQLAASTIANVKTVASS